MLEVFPPDYPSQAHSTSVALDIVNNYPDTGLSIGSNIFLMDYNAVLILLGHKAKFPRAVFLCSASGTL